MREPTDAPAGDVRMLPHPGGYEMDVKMTTEDIDLLDPKMIVPGTTLALEELEKIIMADVEPEDYLELAKLRTAEPSLEVLEIVLKQHNSKIKMRTALLERNTERLHNRLSTLKKQKQKYIPKLTEEEKQQVRDINSKRIPEFRKAELKYVGIKQWQRMKAASGIIRSYNRKTK